MRKALMGSVSAVVLALGGAVLSPGAAFAYGSADQPLAQVEISGNCDNPSFELCQEVGVGGIWTWAELDTAGGNGTSGTMDYTISFCDHTYAGTGPHAAGAFGHPGEGQWWTITSLDQAPAGAFPFFDPSQSYEAYYVLDFSADGFMAVVPAGYGHYSSPGDWPAGAQFQTQVAP